MHSFKNCGALVEELKSGMRRLPRPQNVPLDFSTWTFLTASHHCLEPLPPEHEHLATSQKKDEERRRRITEKPYPTDHTQIEQNDSIVHATILPVRLKTRTWRSFSEKSGISGSSTTVEKRCVACQNQDFGSWSLSLQKNQPWFLGLRQCFFVTTVVFKRNPKWTKNFKFLWTFIRTFDLCTLSEDPFEKRRPVNVGK